jgi:hypothetical protein
MENSINKSEYYTNIMMDVRDVFIGFGRYLEKNNINKQGDICDYEDYLNNIVEQEENFIDTDYVVNAEQSVRDEELTEFLCWIIEQSNWDHEIAIIRQESWDTFWNSEDKYEKDIDMEIVQASDFYEVFERIIGINDFNECFVHMKYIDEMQNSINLIVNVNDRNQRFIIDLV